MAVTGYLAPSDANVLVRKALDRIPDIREYMSAMNGRLEVTEEELDKVESKLKSFQAGQCQNEFGGISESEIPIYRKLFHALANASQSHRTAKDVIEAMLNQS